MAEEYNKTQLINGDGVFNVAGLDSFIQSMDLAKCDLSYAVVAIMGPQSSGKSTLLNHLFQTKFDMMNAATGRWCNDLGREHGANKPLLRTVFEVMTKLFTPRKTTLMFVIRDQIETPIEILGNDLKAELNQIWDEIQKPEGCKDSKLSDFFNVKVTGLTNYKYKKEEFIAQVAELKNQFQNSIAPEGLAGDTKERVPASGFSYSAHQIWGVIKENKDLDLPNLKVVVASFRCEEISNEKLCHLRADERWLALEATTKSGKVASGFGEQLSSMLEVLLSEYDKEALYFHEGVRNEKRHQLLSNLLQVVRPIYDTLLEHLVYQANERFEIQMEKALSKGEGFAASAHNCKVSCMHEFDKQCADALIQQATDWDASDVREKLSRKIEENSSSLYNKKLDEIVARCEKKLSETMGNPIESLLRDGTSESWPSIRKLLKQENKGVELEFRESVYGFDLNEPTHNQMMQRLRDYARSLVEKKTRDTAKFVLLLMDSRFSKAFSNDEDNIPRVWNGNEDIKKIALDARTKCRKMLSVVAVVRLDEESDTIEDILLSSIKDSGDFLVSTVWDKVSPQDTILTPVECKSLWTQFIGSTETIISQAQAAANIYQQKKFSRSVTLDSDDSSGSNIISKTFDHAAEIAASPFKLVAAGAKMVGKKIWR